jgi:hypothetical protein
MAEKKESPRSAEAKALERLKDLDNSTQWVDADNQEIDLSLLDKKISDSGYLSATEDTTTTSPSRPIPHPPRTNLSFGVRW